jgi:hypothetical protein
VVWGWILFIAMVVYLSAMIIASVRLVPDGKMGVVLGVGKPRRLLSKGMHVVFPFGNKVVLIPKGPERIIGDVKDVLTKDGWRLIASAQLNARVVDEQLAALETEDWRRSTLDTMLQVVRMELENNDAVDLRPRPHALDEGCRVETNVLTDRFGVKVDWLRVTIRWAHASPPVHTPPSYALKDGDQGAPATMGGAAGGQWQSIPGVGEPPRPPRP